MESLASGSAGLCSIQNSGRDARGKGHDGDDTRVRASALSTSYNAVDRMRIQR